MKWIGTDQEREVRKVMMEYLPKIYENSKVVNEIVRVDAEEIENYYDSITDVFNQYFVTTATWGLTHWEKALSLPTDETLSYELRRAKILARISGNNTFTYAEALALAKMFSYSKIGVTFTEYNELDAFSTGYEVDDLTSIKDLLLAFEEVKPAHLLHIISLMIRLPYFEKDTLNIVVETIQTVLFNFKLLSKEKIIMMLSDVTYILLDGSINLDGSILLDSLNTYGVNIFYNRSLKLTIQTYSNGVLIEEIIV